MDKKNNKRKKKMAYMIPSIANRKNCRRSNPGAVLTGLLIFLVFGIMFFLFFNRSGVFGFNFSIVFWIGGFMIFIAIILIVSVSAATISKTYKNPRNGNIYRQQSLPQNQIIQLNPYKVLAYENNVKENLDKKVPAIEVINYCRYCGAKKDMDAVFCHMCGIKF